MSSIIYYESMYIRNRCVGINNGNIIINIGYKKLTWTNINTAFYLYTTSAEQP